MKKRWEVLVFVVLAVGFLVANRAAYQGYFSADDLDNLVQTRGASVGYFVRGLLSPELDRMNFRPIGHFCYKVLGMAAGLHFRPFVTLLQGFALLNLGLLWLFIRRSGATGWGAAAGVALLGFHMACFSAYWKPMFLFDVLCGTLVLLALLLYQRGWWLAGLVPFWMACKTKESAVTLAAVLLAWELLPGERKWKRTLPYLAIAALLVGQAMLNNRSTDTAYTLRLSGSALWTTLAFYLPKMLLAPLGAVVMIALAVLVRDKRVWWGLAATLLLVGPMWLLPVRMNVVYLYVPLIGLAFAVGHAAGRLSPLCVGLMVLGWAGFNYYQMRPLRGVELQAGAENRLYVQAVGEMLQGRQDARAVIYSGGPTSLKEWGRSATMRWFEPSPKVTVLPIESAEARPLFGEDRVVVLHWDALHGKLENIGREPGAPDPSAVDMARGNPVWLMGEGWYVPESGYRWMGERATLRLRRPVGAREFRVKVNVPVAQVNQYGGVELEVLLDGVSLGVRKYLQSGYHEQRWSLTAGDAGTRELTLRSLTPLKGAGGDERMFGAAIASLGFVD